MSESKVVPSRRGKGDSDSTENQVTETDDIEASTTTTSSTTPTSSLKTSKAGKSVSDTAILGKRSTHSKAMSTHRLGQHSQETSQLLDDILASSTSSGTSLGDSGNEKNEDESQDNQPASVMKQKSAKENLHPNLRQRKVSPSSQHQEQKQGMAKQGAEEQGKVDEDDGDLENAHGSFLDEEQTWREKKAYYSCWLILTLLSYLTRLYNIEIPAHVCWDETHFGKMGSWYINHTFFFDVHPPLGKMLIGLAGVLTGYDGSFPFSKPGDAYGDISYVGMRVFCAMLGAFLVPLAYQSVWLLTHSILAAIFASTLILFESQVRAEHRFQPSELNTGTVLPDPQAKASAPILSSPDTGVLTLSRHILLDPILMFFIMLSTYCCLKFLSFRHSSFSLSWWFWMAATGIALAGAIGVKFVGLFVILLVGYTTAADLWNLLGDLSVSMWTLFKHVGARVICLIAVPSLVYCLIFAVHFKVLDHSGNGDGFFSSGFQSGLIGNKLHNVSMPQNIAFGSVITLKQRRTGGAYLHSHAHLYPEEHPPKQQQVTTYSHKDENNKWKIKPADREVNGSEEVIYVQSGDLVRLEHLATRRNLHSHKEHAPLSKHHYQVSGYGQNGTGDANDIWLVEVEGASQGDRIQTVRSKIKFIHYHVRCLLYSHDKKLPKWGWEQLEVTCQPNLRDTTAVWSIEEVYDARLPNVSFEVYSPTFVEKFLESHAVMTQGNSGLKPKEGEITSRPWQWPLDYRGQVFSGSDHRIYMLGNPVIFWSLLGIKVIFFLVWTAFRISRKRNSPINKNLKIYCERTFKVCWWLLLGWFLHYVPFWGMSRVLYFHHYFPAFLFSAMFGGVMLDFLVNLTCVCVPESIALTMFNWCLLVISASVMGSFYLFYPLVYGMSGPSAQEEGGEMKGLKWMDSWDI